VLSWYPIDPPTEKYLFLKLPSTFGLQPQRVSWSDNKMAPLPGRGVQKLIFLGERQADLFLDDRQGIDTIRL
jgi:hypothetical protein